MNSVVLRKRRQAQASSLAQLLNRNEHLADALKQWARKKLAASILECSSGTAVQKQMRIEKDEARNTCIHC